VEFDLRVSTAGANDRLIVSLGDRELAALPLGQSSGFSSQRVAIPSDLRNAAHTLTFRIASLTGSSIQAVIDIDNVALHAGGRTGDLIPIDLKVYTPGENGFATIGWELLPAAVGGSLGLLETDRNVLRGDHHLQRNGETIAYALFSDRIEGSQQSPGEDFKTSGRLVLAPRSIQSSPRIVPRRPQGSKEQCGFGTELAQNQRRKSSI
jgi:hypothetical protein